MSSLALVPVHHPLNATVRVPGSKSLTNRALLIAALADGMTCLTNALFSDDSRVLAEALKTLGFDVQLDPGKGQMIVHGLGGRIPASKAELFVGNSGTTARFLTAFLTIGNGEYVLDGEARMRERPLGDLAVALESLGARVESTGGLPSGVDRHLLCPPVKIISAGLPGGEASVAGNISSQFLSALLMVAPYAQRRVELSVTTELNSKPYVDMTLAVMADFGINIVREGYQRFTVQPGRYLPRHTYPIESDASAASYFFAAPAILGGTIRVEDISRGSMQGDIGFLSVLERMGCGVRVGDNFIEVSGPHELRGVDADMRDIPDTAQTLAAIAPFAAGPTRIRGIASARFKETDRVRAMCAELTRLGVDVEEHTDGLTIQPCVSLRPASVRTYRDHRMAMAFALIGLRAPGVVIENPGCVSKTFPDYFEVLETLR